MLTIALLVLPFVASPVVRGDRAPPRVSVDLDQDPEHRWDHIVADHKDSILRSFRAIVDSPHVKPFVPLMERLVGNEWEARRLFRGTQLLEVKGIARALGVSVGELVLLSSFYDIFAATHSPLAMRACTGVVAQTQSGEIIHGRNLDYDFKEALANVTFVVDFTRRGSTVFTGVTFGPSPTFNTAVRYGNFSVSQDERNRGNVGTNLFDMLVRGRAALFSQIRHAVETLDNFEDAVTFFSGLKLNAASYFIIGGTKAGEGAVVTMDRDAVADVWRLDAAAGQWYVLETNYDHTSPPPTGDDRRHPVQRALNSTGQAGINVRTMWDAISVTDVNTTGGERAPLNEETVYSTVMQASKPESFKTIVRQKEMVPWQTKVLVI